MAYSDFTLEKLEEDFGTTNQVIKFFDNNVAQIPPSDWLRQSVAFSEKLRLRTEKAKSEWVVAPILSEVLRRNEGLFTVFSGENLNVDAKRGLKGECDFILTKETHTFNMNYPIIHIVEAKNSDLDLGVAQCAAQLFGANIFNNQKQMHVPLLYGCVTNALHWRFIKLETNCLFVDTQLYTTQNLPELLGVFQVIIDYYKKKLIKNHDGIQRLYLRKIRGKLWNEKPSCFAI
jgi:hypothetical protein